MYGMIDKLNANSHKYNHIIDALNLQRSWNGNICELSNSIQSLNNRPHFCLMQLLTEPNNLCFGNKYMNKDFDYFLLSHN